MRKSKMYQSGLLAVVLSATGCGAIPDVIVDAAKESARDALQEVVNDAVGQVIDDTVEGWLEFPDLAFDDLADEEDSAMDDPIGDESELPEQDEEDANDSGGRR